MSEQAAREAAFQIAWDASFTAQGLMTDQYQIAQAFYRAAWAACEARADGEDWKQRYFNLYNATRTLCALVDATIPNMMMTPDQQSNAYGILVQMKAALKAGEGHAVRPAGEGRDGDV